MLNALGCCMKPLYSFDSVPYPFTDMIRRSCLLFTPKFLILSLPWFAHAQGATDVGSGGRMYLPTFLSCSLSHGCGTSDIRPGCIKSSYSLIPDPSVLFQALAIMIQIAPCRWFHETAPMSRKLAELGLSLVLL